jgi:hypothetical protein
VSFEESSSDALLELARILMRCRNGRWCGDDTVVAAAAAGTARRWLNGMLMLMVVRVMRHHLMVVKGSEIACRSSVNSLRDVT